MRIKKKVQWNQVCMAVCAIITYIFVGVEVVYLNLRPEEVSINNEELFENAKDLDNFNMSNNGKLKIIDSTPSIGNDNQQVRVYYKCTYHTYDDSWSNCLFTMELFSYSYFPQLVVNCPSGECNVSIESNYFAVGNLFVFGERVSMKTQKLTAKNFFFDTIQGNLLIELFNGDSASVSTTFGDIAIQTLKETKLSTLSSTKSVCVSSEQGWKDSTTKISDLKQVFDEKDPATQTCFDVFGYSDRNYSQMVSTSKHALFDSLTKSPQAEPFDSRCISITDLLLLRSKTDVPTSISSFITIRAANSEGNIFVNVLSNAELDVDNKNVPATAVISKSIQDPSNPLYDMSDLSISETWVKQLNDTFNSIKEQGKFNEIVFLNFGQENTRDLQWMVLFTPLYLHFAPKWISLFSLYLLSSQQEEHLVGLSQGFCPYIFRYNETDEYLSSDSYIKDSQSRLSSRKSAVKVILDKFFEEINVEPYITISFQEYQDLKVRNPSSYPNSKDISKQLKVLIFGEVILFWVLFLSLGVIPNFIFSKIREVKQKEEFSNKTRIIYYLQQMIKNKDKESQSFPFIECESHLIPIRQDEENHPQNKNIEMQNQTRNGINFSKVVPLSTNKLKENIHATNNLTSVDQARGELKQTWNDMSERKNSLVPQTMNEMKDDIPATDTPIPVEKEQNVNEDSFLIQPMLEGDYENHFVVLENEFNYTYYEMITHGASWLQKRWINSLELFYSLLFLDIYHITQQGDNSQTGIKIDDFTEEDVVMKLDELNSWYQHFCFQYNFQCQDILSKENKLLLDKYDFEINYEKIIFFKDDKSQYKDWNKCQIILEPQSLYYIQNLSEEWRKQFQKEFTNLPYFELFSQITKREFDSRETNEPPSYKSQQPIYKQLLTRSVKVSPYLVLSRKTKSTFIINKLLLAQMMQQFGINALKIDNSVKENQKQELNSNKSWKFHLLKNEKKLKIDYRSEIDLNYIQLMFFGNVGKIKLDTEKFKFLFQSILNAIIFIISPVLLLLFQIVVIYIYVNEEEKTYEGITIGIWDILSSWGLMIPIIFGISFAGFFYYQVRTKKKFFRLSNDCEIPFKVSLNHVRDIPLFELNQEVWTIRAQKYLFMLLGFINIFVLDILLFYSIIYIFATLAILIIGSIMIPSVTLPSVIFLVALITVIYDQIIKFKSLREKGESKLNEIFKKNILSKFKQVQIEQLKTVDQQILPKQQQNQAQSVQQGKEEKQQEPEQQTQEEGQKGQLRKEGSDEKQKQEEREKQQQEQLKLNQEQGNQEESLFDDYQEEDYYDLREFNKMYNNLVNSKQCNVQSENIDQLFKKMNMPIQQEHLNQMFAHAKVEVDLEKEKKKKKEKEIIFLGDKSLLTLNKKEFERAINYFLGSKIQQAFNNLKVSYLYLALLIINTIAQSILIMVLVYSVFKGLQAKEAPFSLGVDNIATIAGIFGILLSNKEKQAQQLEDEEKLKNIVMEVERIFHGQDIEFEETQEDK